VQFTPTGYTITATVQQTLLLDRWLNSFGGQVRNVKKESTDLFQPSSTKKMN
jgi:hypothetical protein